MIKRNKKFIFNSIIYIFSTFGNKGIEFLLLPIFTRLLTPDDYGHIAMFVMWVAIMQPLIHLNSFSAIVRFYYGESKKEIAEYVGISVIISFFMFLFWSLIVLVLSDLLFQYFSLNGKWLFLGLVGAMFFSIYYLYLSLLRVKENAVKYGIIQNLYSLVNIGVAIILVVYLRYNWTGRTWGIVFTNVVFGLLMFYFLYKEGFLHFSFDKDKLKRILEYGVPLILHNVSSILAASTDKFFLNNMISTSVVGLYNVSFMIAMIIGTTASSVHLAFLPYAYGEFEKKKYKNVLLTGVGIVIFIFSVFLFLFFMRSFIFNIFIGSKFSTATKFFPYLGLSQAFMSIYYLGATFTFWYKKTKYISIITFSYFILNMLLNYYFINYFGDIGAARATLVSTIYFAVTSFSVGIYLFVKDKSR